MKFRVTRDAYARSAPVPPNPGELGKPSGQQTEPKGANDERLTCLASALASAHAERGDNDHVSVKTF